jgi:hypothetical protein
MARSTKNSGGPRSTLNRFELGKEVDAIVNTLCVLRCAVSGSRDDTDRDAVALMMFDLIERVEALPTMLGPVASEEAT